MSDSYEYFKAILTKEYNDKVMVVTRAVGLQIDFNVVQVNAGKNRIIRLDTIIKDFRLL